MPVAEIKIRTTHDGTQAERSLGNLEKSVDRLSSTVSTKLSRAIAGLFTVEKVVMFARSVDETVSSVGKLVEKLREGKSTLEEVNKKSGLAPSSTGSLAGIDETRGKQLGVWSNVKALAARAYYLAASTAQVQAFTGDPLASNKAAHAIYGDLGTLGVADMQGILATQQAKKEELRQQRIKEIIDAEENSTGRKSGFGYQAGVTGRYFGPGIPSFETQQAHRSVDLERQSLDELRRITRILDRGPSTNSSTVFPQ